MNFALEPGKSQDPGMCCTATGSVQSAVGSFLFYIHVGRTSGKAEGRLLMGTVLSSGTGGAGRFGASAGGMGAEGSRDGGVRG